MTPTELRMLAGRLEIGALMLRTMRRPVALELEHLVLPIEADVLLEIIASALHDRADEESKARG